MKKKEKKAIMLSLIVFSIFLIFLITLPQEEPQEVYGEAVWTWTFEDEYGEVIWEWETSEEDGEMEGEIEDEIYWTYWYPVEKHISSIFEVFQIENIFYNISELNKEAVNQAQKYFKDINLTNVSITYSYLNWLNSFYSDDEKVIVAYLGGIEDYPEYYNLLLTHEYVHYILYRLNVTSTDLHESIADTYTLFLNKEAHLKLWGKDNSGRDYPYDIFVDTILAEDNFNCLYNVYNKNKKIENVDEILYRLDKYCDVQYDYNGGNK